MYCGKRRHQQQQGRPPGDRPRDGRSSQTRPDGRYHPVEEGRHMQEPQAPPLSATATATCDARRGRARPITARSTLAQWPGAAAGADARLRTDEAEQEGGKQVSAVCLSARLPVCLPLIAILFCLALPVAPRECRISSAPSTPPHVSPLASQRTRDFQGGVQSAYTAALHCVPVSRAALRAERAGHTQYICAYGVLRRCTGSNTAAQHTTAQHSSCSACSVAVGNADAHTAAARDR